MVNLQDTDSPGRLPSDLSTSTIDSALGSLEERLVCPLCRNNLRQQVKNIIVQWANIKVSFLQSLRAGILCSRCSEDDLTKPLCLKYTRSGEDRESESRHTVTRSSCHDLSRPDPHPELQLALYYNTTSTRPPARLCPYYGSSYAPSSSNFSDQLFHSLPGTLSLLPIKKSLLPIHGPHRPLHFRPRHFCFCKHIVKNPINISLLLGLGIVRQPSRVVSQWCTNRVSFVDLLPHGLVLLFEGTINAGNHHAFPCCFRSRHVTLFCLLPPRIVTFSFTTIIGAGHAQQKNTTDVMLCDNYSPFTYSIMGAALGNQPPN